VIYELELVAAWKFAAHGQVLAISNAMMMSAAASWLAA